MTTLDSTLVAVCQAIYGDAVDPYDLAKSMDAADVHVDGALPGPPMQYGRKTLRRRRQLVGKDAAAQAGTAPQPGKKKLLAAGLLAGTAVEGLAVGHTLGGLSQGIKDIAPAVKDAENVAGKAKALKPLFAGPPKQILAGTAAPGTNAALQAGNFAVGLGAAKELAGPKKQQTSKALRLSLKPLNPQSPKVVSLRAREGVRKSLTAHGEISKVDEEKRQVFGWASVSELDGVEIEDRQGDSISTAELEKAAYGYVLSSRIGGDQHTRIAKADTVAKHTSDMIESMVFTDEKCEALGLPDSFPRGWWVGYQIHDDESWSLVKSGGRAGFSIHGAGVRTSVEKADFTYTEEKKIRRREEGRSLGERVRQAKNPPPVRRQRVSSTAVHSLGYQPQTRRLSVEMNSRPGEPYEYRVPKKTARKVLGAPSKGRAYTTEIRGKQPRHDRFKASDRARLFASPQ